MKKKMIMFLCSFSLLNMTACSGKEEQPEVVIKSYDELKQNDNSHQKEEGTTDTQENTQKDEISSENTEENINEDIKEGTEILDGNIESIGDGIVVVNKTYTYEMDEGLIAVSSADEDGNKTLVTVNLPEGVKYELHTVKNSGINGDADVTKSEASFSDIKEGAGVKFTGYYVTEEEEFTAESVVIYHFV